MSKMSRFKAEEAVVMIFDEEDAGTVSDDEAEMLNDSTEDESETEYENENLPKDYTQLEPVQNYFFNENK